MKKLLFIAYYFPPLGMGGTQRSAKFVKYLPAFDWEPIVLTVKDVTYYAHDSSLIDEIKHTTIVRTESLDPLRLMARFKKDSSQDKAITEQETPPSRIANFLNRIITGWLLIPDSKILWLPFALISALRLIREHNIRVVYTTSPPHSAHLLGLILKIMKKVNWIADFRDDWTGGESQPCPTYFHHLVNRFWEKAVLRSADRVVAMCDHLRGQLAEKSGQQTNPNKLITITNGYDPDDFRGLLNAKLSSQFTITHCGSISKVSDPKPFLKAVRDIFNAQPELRGEIKVQFVGTDIFGRLRRHVDNLNLEEIISPITYLPHRDALKKIMASHLLLLVIHKKTSEEIMTSKVFEYLASGKPVLLLSSPGEVASMIRKMNRGQVVEYNDIKEIKNAIEHYYQKYKNGSLTFEKPLSVTQFDRKELTKKLAQVISEIQT